MSHAFAEIAFTPSVKAAQQRDGSPSNYARNFEGDAEVDFIAAPRRFYMATNDRIAELEERIAHSAAGSPASG